VGLPNDQEKVVRFWRSLRPDIQQELYRKDLDAEISSWDEDVLAAERAEVWLKLDVRFKNTTANVTASNHTSNNNSSGGKRNPQRFSRRNGRGRGGAVMRTYSVAIRPVPTEPRSDKASAGSSKFQKRGKASEDRPMSAKKRNEMLAQGRCFTCEEVGHLARNCPKTTNVVSTQKGKPPGFGLHAAQFSNTAESALFESTEVLNTLPIGAIGLAFDAEDVIEEGGNPTENLNEISDQLSDQDVEYSLPTRGQ
jgi:hypothetical protein